MLLASPSVPRSPRAPSRRELPLAAVALAALAKPLPGNQKVYPAKELCSRCGFCNTSLVHKVSEACAFLGHGMAKLDAKEEAVHGRRRTAEELYFGVSQEGPRPLRVVKGRRPPQRAWTGVVTSVAVEALRRGHVDAVLCVGSAASPLEPRPLLARSAEEVLRCGGVKPMLSPNLLPLEELLQVQNDVRRLLFIGVGCQVQALRAVEEDLKLEKLYVLGTNCVDNPRDLSALRRFLASASERPESCVGFEFMQDNRIHLKHSDGSYERVPIFSLKEPEKCSGVIAKSCYACFDYVNALADLTVGYMAAPWEGKKMTEHRQYCVVRNERGQELLELLGGALELGEAVDLKVEGRVPRQPLLSQVLRPELNLAFGRQKQREPPPRWLAELLCDLLTAVGPQGLDFAKASIDRATLRNLVCLEVDLARKRAGRPPPLEETLPRHERHIRDANLELFESFVREFRGAEVL